MRKALEDRLSGDEPVLVSFDSVLKVSQSFSDEFLCALVEDLGPQRVKIEEELTPSVKRVLSRALRRRGFGSLDQFVAVPA